MGAGVQENEATEVLARYRARKYRYLTPKKYRYKILYGGRGSGKSWQVAESLLLIAKNTKVRVLCVREIQNSIKDSVWKLLCDTIDSNRWTRDFVITEKSISCSKTGSEFIFKGLRLNPSIKSTEGIDYCWVEEAQHVSNDSWELLIPTVRKPNSEIWITFNPDVAETPVWDRFITHTRGDALIEQVNWSDNPFFPSVLREEKDYLYRVDPEAAANVWEGELRSNTNACIFKGKYVIEPFDDDLWRQADRLFFGADFGFANDPSTLIRCFTLEHNLYIDYEAYKVGVEITQLKHLYASVPGSDDWQIKADCARPETISHLRKVDGFNIIGAEKWKGSIEDGIAYIRGFEKVIIHPRCKHTIDEFRLYSYKVDKISGDVLPVPEDKMNHCVAEGTLITTLRGDIPVESVTEGDKVLTREGFRCVLACAITDRDREVLCIETENHSIMCTEEHRIFTVNRGYVEAKELTTQDTLLCLKSNRGTQETTRKSDFVAERVRRITVRKRREPRVYDLTIDAVPEFFADGILVHNCIDALRYSLSDYIKHKGGKIHPSNLRALRYR